MSFNIIHMMNRILSKAKHIFSGVPFANIMPSICLAQVDLLPAIIAVRIIEGGMTNI